MEVIAAFPITSMFVLITIVTAIVYVIWRAWVGYQVRQLHIQARREMLSAEASRKLEAQLEMQDPWYPKHNDWIHADDLRDLWKIERIDPILAIQTKLELWMEYQDRRMLPIPDIPLEKPSKYGLEGVVRDLRWGALDKMGQALTVNEMRKAYPLDARAEAVSRSLDKGVPGPIPRTFAG